MLTLGGCHDDVCGCGWSWNMTSLTPMTLLQIRKGHCRLVDLINAWTIPHLCYANIGQSLEIQIHCFLPCSDQTETHWTPTQVACIHTNAHTCAYTHAHKLSHKHEPRPITSGCGDLALVPSQAVEGCRCYSHREADLGALHRGPGVTHRYVS